MAYSLLLDPTGVIIRLTDSLIDDDYDRIQDDFEAAMERGAGYVILDLEQLGGVTNAVVGLIGTLRLQCRRRGAVLELRNVGPRHMGTTDSRTKSDLLGATL
ncbi:STAS domain-containing protein [Paramagnetospirillum kuznetsovii]|nr:STAS domain-containing protein [Paramagnetospirillum kuznetsovii]